MFKKLNIKTLVIILVVLVVIYFIADKLGNKERSFRSQVVKVDTASVSDIFIYIPDGNTDIHLNRNNEKNGWELIAEGNNFNADPNIVKNILTQLSDLKPERVAANDESKWNQFEVSDSTGIHVVLKDDNKELADVYIGKFSYTQPPQTGAQNPYQQQRGKMTSYIRVGGENEVYAVDGFLKMSYQKDINSYRNKSLVKVNNDDLSRLVFTYPENETFTLTKEEDKWFINGEPADSAKTVRYISKISRLSSSSFVDPSTLKISDFTHKLKIEGNNFTPIELQAYPSDTITQYVITSTENEGAEFSGSKAKLFEKTFVNIDEFLPGEDKK